MADDVASLGFAIDSSQMVVAAKAAKGLTTATGEVEKAVQRLAPSQSLAATAQARLIREQQIAATTARAVTRAQAELGDKVELLTRNTDLAYRSLSTRSFFRLLAREASLVGGPLGQAIGQFGILNVGGQRLGVGLTSATIGFAAVAAAAVKTVSAFIALESHQATLNNALTLTAGASGQSVQNLERMAQELSRAGTQSIGDLRGAQAELVRFRAVSGDAFERTMQLAQDLASTGFVDLKGAVTAFGGALSDPINRLKELEAAGVHFSPTQEKMIADFVKVGDILKSQNAILKIANDQIGGAAKTTDTFSSSWMRMSNSFLTSMGDWGRTVAEVLRLKTAMDALSLATNPAELQRRLGLAAPKGDRLTASPTAQLGNALSQRGTLLPTFNPEEWNALSEKMRTAQETIDKVTIALAKEAKEAGLTEIQVRTLAQQHAAQVAPTSAAGVAIRNYVNAIEAIKDTRQITDQIKLSTAAVEIESRVLFMTTGAGAAYRAEMEALAREKIKGVEISSALAAKIHDEAGRLGEATAAAERLKQINEMGGAALSGFFTDLSHGVSKIDAARNALTRLSDTLIDMATRKLWSSALGGLFGAIGTTGGVGTVSGAEWVNAGKGLGPLAAGHTGGIVGQIAATRYVHPAYFDNAPRFGRGGIVGGEVPLIAHMGEGIFTPAQMKAMGRGGGDIHVTIGGPVVNVQGDASENTIRLIQRSWAEYDRTLQPKVIHAIQDAKRRTM